MAANHARLPQRRGVAQRVKADENAMSRHLRQGSNVTAAGAARFSAKEATSVKPAQRIALGEVTTIAVNRKDTGSKLNTGKDKDEVSLKRGRSDSTTLPQRVPLGPGRGQVAPPVANTVTARVPLARARAPVVSNKRISRSVAPVVVTQEVDEVRHTEAQIAMDVEDDLAAAIRDEEEAEENVLQATTSSQDAACVAGSFYRPQTPL